MKIIEITFAEDGQTTIEAHGISGPSCKAETADFEKLLGVASSTVRKSDFFSPPASHQPPAKSTPRIQA